MSGATPRNSNPDNPGMIIPREMLAAKWNWKWKWNATCDENNKIDRVIFPRNRERRGTIYSSWQIRATIFSHGKCLASGCIVKRNRTAFFPLLSPDRKKSSDAGV